MGRGRARWLIFGGRQGKGRRERGGRGGRDEFDGNGVTGGGGSSVEVPFTSRL
jgi:hypothetical protein